MPIVAEALVSPLLEMQCHSCYSMCMSLKNIAYIGLHKANGYIRRRLSAYVASYINVNMFREQDVGYWQELVKFHSAMLSLGGAAAVEALMADFDSNRPLAAAEDKGCLDLWAATDAAFVAEKLTAAVAGSAWTVQPGEHLG